MSTTTDIEIYLDTKLEYRWRLRDPSNGEIIAASTEGYVKESDCLANVKRIKWLFGLEINFTQPKQR